MFKIYNSKQKARLCCYDKNKKAPLDRRNIGITKPLLIHRVRQEEIKKKNNKVYQENTINKFYNSNGYGRSCSNRKQMVFTEDKTKKINAPPGRRGKLNKCSNYCTGFMTKYQAKLQANVGAGDRLSRVKALAIRKSSTSNFRFVSLPNNIELNMCNLSDYLKNISSNLSVESSYFNGIVDILLQNKKMHNPNVSNPCSGLSVTINHNIPDGTFNDLTGGATTMKQTIKINWSATINSADGTSQTIYYCQLFTIDFNDIKLTWDVRPPLDLDISYQEDWKSIYTEIKHEDQYYVITKANNPLVFEKEREKAETIGYKIFNEVDKDVFKGLAEAITLTFTFKTNDTIYFITENSFNDAAAEDPVFPVDNEDNTNVYIVLKNPERKRTEITPKISFNCYLLQDVEGTENPEITAPALLLDSCTQKLTVRDGTGWTFTSFYEPIDSCLAEKPDVKYIAVKRWTYTDIFGREFHTDQRLFVRDKEPPVFKDWDNNEITDVEYLSDDKLYRKNKKPKYVDKFWDPNTCDNDEVNIVPEWISEEKPVFDSDNKYTVKQTWKAQDEEGNKTEEDKTLIVRDITAPTFIGQLDVLYFDTKDDLTVDDKFTTPVASDEMDKLIDHPTVVAPVDQRSVWSGAATNNSIDNNDSLPEWDPCKKQYKFTRKWKATDQAGNEAVTEQIYYVKDLNCPTFTGGSQIVYTTKTDYDTKFTKNGNGMITGICDGTDCGVPQVGDDFNLEELEDGKSWPQKFPDGTIFYNPDTNKYEMSRLWWAKDKSGNVSVFTQKFIIEHNKKPEFVDFPLHKRVSRLVDLNPFQNINIGCPKGKDILDKNPIISYEDRIIDLDDTNDAINIERTWKVTNEADGEATQVQKIQVFEIENLDVNGDGKNELVVTEEILGLATGHYRHISADDTDKTLVFELDHQNQDGSIEYSGTEKKLYGCFTNIGKTNEPENVKFTFYAAGTTEDVPVVFDNKCQFKFEVGDVPDGSTSVTITYNAFTDDEQTAKQQILITKDLVKVETYKTTIISYVDEDLNQELGADEIVIDSVETFGTDDNEDGVLEGDEITSTTYKTNRPVVTIISPTPVVEAGTTSFTLTHSNYVTAKDDGGNGIDLTPAVISDSNFDINKPGTYEITYQAKNDAGYVSDPKSLTIEVQDTTPPTFTAKPDFTIELNEDYDLLTGVTAVDNSGDPVTIEVTSNGGFNKSQAEKYTITYKATDPTGNFSTETRTITVVQYILEAEDSIVAQDSTAVPSKTFDDIGITINRIKNVKDGNAEYDLVRSYVPETGVDLSKIGEYTITYTLTNKQNTDIEKVIMRTVTVKGLPSFTAIPNVTIAQGTDYDLLTGVTAQDADKVDSKVTITVSNDGEFDKDTVDTYTVQYTVTDNDSGGSVTATRTVTVKAPPVITIKGDNPITIEIGSTYTDAGATSDGDDETVTSESTVDTTANGSYTVTYSVTDVAGTTVTAVRNVTVEERTPAVPVIDTITQTTIQRPAGQLQLDFSTYIVTGTGGDGDTISLFYTATSSPTNELTAEAEEGSVKVGADGNWSFTIANDLPRDTYTFTAKATDPDDGNITNSSNSQTLEIN